ncbi:hypothetical protein EJ357_05180 [Streptomyces cyaneochromogenes]|uniref:ATP-binding protein n=1 Tax=Streptomyces cyaneochromogenes TaxID=2496836 RepID=A0A3S9M138_9ACTN|nr:hypothetical protein [Streptomyces cyaneochromogenes]AZQ32914.1 hypothetical protein EJ357_05180 [Streptomyces cyaneochromogenes]
MKKRSMLAIASLATGFVVAAVTPSHAAEAPVTGTPSTETPGLGGGGMKLLGGEAGGVKLAGSETGGTKLAGGETKVAGVNVDQALNTFGRAINRETDRAVNNAPHGKKR